MLIAQTHGSHATSIFRWINVVTGHRRENSAKGISTPTRYPTSTSKVAQTTAKECGSGYQVIRDYGHSLMDKIIDSGSAICDANVSKLI